MDRVSLGLSADTLISDTFSISFFFRAHAHMRAYTQAFRSSFPSSLFNYFVSEQAREHEHEQAKADKQRERGPQWAPTAAKRRSNVDAYNVRNMPRLCSLVEETCNHSNQLIVRQGKECVMDSTLPYIWSEFSFLLVRTPKSSRIVS